MLAVLHRGVEDKHAPFDGVQLVHQYFTFQPRFGMWADDDSQWEVFRRQDRQDQLSLEEFRLLSKLWEATHRRVLPVRYPLNRGEAHRIALSLLFNRLAPEDLLRNWLKVAVGDLGCAPGNEELSYQQ